jgi:hypothetical protein
MRSGACAGARWREREALGPSWASPLRGAACAACNSALLAELSLGPSWASPLRGAACAACNSALLAELSNSCPATPGSFSSPSSSAPIIKNPYPSANQLLVLVCASPFNRGMDWIFYCWCRGRESNSYAAVKLRRILSPVCLPIPPPRLEKRIIASNLNGHKRKKKAPARMQRLFSVFS